MQLRHPPDEGQNRAATQSRGDECPNAVIAQGWLIVRHFRRYTPPSFSASKLGFVMLYLLETCFTFDKNSTTIAWEL